MASRHALNVLELGFKMSVVKGFVHGGKIKLLKIAQVIGKMIHMRSKC